MVSTSALSSGRPSRVHPAIASSPSRAVDPGLWELRRPGHSALSALSVNLPGFLRTHCRDSRPPSAMSPHSRVWARGRRRIDCGRRAGTLANSLPPCREIVRLDGIALGSKAHCRGLLLQSKPLFEIAEATAGILGVLETVRLDIHLRYPGHWRGFSHFAARIGLPEALRVRNRQPIRLPHQRASSCRRICPAAAEFRPSPPGSSMPARLCSRQSADGRFLL